MINTISDNTITGSVEEIQQTYDGLQFSTMQGYCIIFGFFVTLAILIIAIKDVIKNLTNRECLGCKRLKKVEKELEEIKKKESLSDYWDKNAFNAISAKLDILIKEKGKNG